MKLSVRSGILARSKDEAVQLQLLKIPNEQKLQNVDAPGLVTVTTLPGVLQMRSV